MTGIDLCFHRESHDFFSKRFHKHLKKPARKIVPADGAIEKCVACENDPVIFALETTSPRRLSGRMYYPQPVHTEFYIRAVVEETIRFRRIRDSDTEISASSSGHGEEEYIF
jgi:hypothetical protein